MAANLPSRAAKKTGRALLRAALAVLALLCAVPAPADAPLTCITVDPVAHRDNCTCELYNNTNGLPTSEANTIAQTAEGFIWIGSYSGLIRFDGDTFERMDSTTGIASVVCLHVDARDRLWIGTNESGLALMEHGQARLFGDSARLGAPKVTSITEDGTGTVYVGTTNGVTTVSPDLEFRLLDDPLIAGVYVEQLRCAADGAVYCLTNSGRILMLRSGKAARYVDSRNTNIEGITCILPDPDDPEKLYIGTKDATFFHGDPRHDPDTLETVDISPLNTVLDIARFGDQIWIAARNGIGVIDGDGFHLLEGMPMSTSICRMMADYEGNVWFASSRQGVMKLVWNPFTDVFARYSIPEHVVNSTCVYRGRLFVATDNGLIVLDDGGPVSSVPLSRAATALYGIDLGADDLISMLRGCRIRSVIPDSRGRLWISTWMSYGLVCYDGESVTSFTDMDGLLSDHIRAVCESADGSILVANTGGVSVIRPQGDRVRDSYGLENGILNSEILTVCAAPNGDVLAGSNGGGIYVIRDGKARCIGTSDGLTSGIVMRVKYDAGLGVYWIVTSNSIAWMSEDYRVTTVKNFPYSNNFDMYRNSRGDMWILSSNGIYVLPAQDLIDNGEVRPVYYGMANGMPCVSTSNSYSFLSEDGQLYIAGNTGVVRINIESPIEDISDLKQAVPFIDVDGERVYPLEDGSFTVPAGARKVTVHAYVFNYSLTDPKLSYRLEGFDRESTTLALHELLPVTYTNLRGGSYRFVMELKDALGRGSRTLEIAIRKDKALYEQTWFYIAAAAAALLAVGTATRLYIRRRLKGVEARHREAMEKERLVTELSTAARIQAASLPHTFPPFPDRSEFDLYASMDPAREVGGDFYDFFLIDDDHLCLVIADVSGKGIPAALFMMVSKVILQNNAMHGLSPAQILTRANDRISANNRVDMFVTVWLGILEISTGKVVAANAGHEYPALMKGGRFELLRDRHGLVIGAMEGIRYRDYEFTLEKGDRLFVYTDGVPEATAAGDAMFGTDRMLDALNADPAASPEQILKNVRGAVDGFVKDAEQFDDLTMLCLAYEGPKG